MVTSARVAGRSVMRIHSAGRAARDCRWPSIESRRARRRDSTAPAAARRPLAGLPRVLRAAGGELLDHHRAAHQRGLRLHLDADQRAARRAADPRRGRVRQVSRQTFRLERVPEYKAKRNKTPDEFSSQLPLIKEVLDALRIPHLELDGFEADDIIATLDHPGRRRRASRCCILTGDRDSLQLVSEHHHRALPDARRLRAGPDDARRPSRTKYGVPPHRYPELAALVGEASDNLPGVPGVGPEDRRQVDHTSTTASTTSSPTPTRSPARRASAARAPRRRDPQPPAQRAGVRPRPGADARPTWPCSRGTARRCTRSSTAWSSGCCATGSSRRSTSEEEIDESGLRRSTGTRLGARRGGGLARRARADAGPRVGVQVAGHLAAPARATCSRRVALAADDAAAWVDAERARPRGRRGPRRLARRRATPQGAARRQGPDARPGRPRLAAARARRATPRCRPTSPGPTSAPTTWPT